MKIYISGKITDTDIEQTREKFRAACDFLREMGQDPINPLENGLPFDSPWEQHILRDIELLMGCGGIFLLPDWVESRGARIEHAVAKEMGLLILSMSAGEK